MISPKITVVVPVYNVEDYLIRCLESICNQSYSNLEIILVNDGSTDQSGSICDNLSSIDSRIKVIHKINGGLSDARNKGLELATGEFIAFVDSDDYLFQDAYKILINEAVNNNLDIVLSNGIKQFSNSDGSFSNVLIKQEQTSEVMSGLDYMCRSIKSHSYFACVWLNLYKKKVLDGFSFKSGILHEDEEWTPKVLLSANRVKFLNITSYCYVVRENSIMTKKEDKFKNGLDIINTCYYLEDYFIKNVSDKRKKKILDSYLLFIFLGGVYVGRLDRYPFRKKVKKSFVIGKSINRKDIFKSIIFLINIKLYILLNSFSKASRWG